MTYGDKIRNMSDEELAEFLGEVSNNGDDYLFKIPGMGCFAHTDDIAEKLGEEIDEKISEI